MLYVLTTIIINLFYLSRNKYSVRMEYVPAAFIGKLAPLSFVI